MISGVACPGWYKEGLRVSALSLFFGHFILVFDLLYGSYMVWVHENQNFKRTETKRRA